MSVAGDTVVVTGAGTGIGRAVALRLLGGGANVVLVGRREGALGEVAEEAAAAGSGGKACVVAADVGEPAAARRVAEAAAALGRVDGLVNNAGLARFGAIEDADLDGMESMIDVHLRGPVYLTRACLPHLRATRGGIVNVTSVGGALALPGRSLYGATKAALNSLTRSLARELAPDVRVNAVLPGPVETPMYDDLGLDEPSTRRLREDLVRMTPMGRFGRPDEVAGWVCALLDRAVSSWVTGTLLPVDGGRTA